MIRMYSEKGGYMDCKTAKEAIRASEKGWVPVIETAPEKKAPAKKTAVKKTRKPRAKK